MDAAAAAPAAGSSSSESGGGGKSATEPALRITAPRGGFRRAGRRWSGTSTVPVRVLTEDEIAALKAEPRLTVEVVEVEATVREVLE